MRVRWENVQAIDGDREKNIRELAEQMTIKKVDEKPFRKKRVYSFFKKLIDFSFIIVLTLKKSMLRVLPQSRLLLLCCWFHFSYKGWQRFFFMLAVKAFRRAAKGHEKHDTSECYNSFYKIIVCRHIKRGPRCVKVFHDRKKKRIRNFPNFKHFNKFAKNFKFNFSVME